MKQHALWHAFVFLLHMLLSNLRQGCPGVQGSFFNVRVSFSHEDAGITFSPDDFGVTEAMITNAVQGAVGLLSSLPRVLHTRSFVPFYEGKPSCTRLEHVVRCHVLLFDFSLAAHLVHKLIMCSNRRLVCTCTCWCFTAALFSSQGWCFCIRLTPAPETMLHV